MRTLALFTIVVLTAFTTTAMAGPTGNKATEEAPVATKSEMEGLTPVQIGQLLPIKHGILQVDRMLKNGVITKTQANQAVSNLVKRVPAITGQPLNMDQLMALTVNGAAAPPPLTALQRFAGVITFINILWVLGIILFVVCAVILFGHAIKRLIFDMPREVWEALLGIGGIGLAIGAYWLEVGVREYVAFLGLLLFGGALGIIISHHRLEKHKVAFMALMAVAAGAVAVVFTSQLNGFLAVAALTSALGFSVIITPLCYFIGFEDEKAVGQTTAAALVMMAGYVLLKIFAVDNPQLMAFETGAVFMGAFVGCLGLLIASSLWYRGRKNYALTNLLALAVMFAAVAIGSIWQIGTLQGIGGTFLVLWATEKFMEIPSDSIVGWAFKGLMASGFFIAVCWVAKSYPDSLQQYLLF